MHFMQAVGIHVDGSMIRRALVRKEGNKILIKGVQVAGGVNPLYTESSTTPLVSGLSSDDVMIHSLSYPGRKSPKLRQALIMQSQAQLHLNCDELISVALLDAKTKKATVYSTTHHALSSHLEELSRFHQDPDRVSAVPEALKAFLLWKAPSLRSYLVVDFGFKKTHCVWVEEGCVQRAQALFFGVLDLEEPERARLFRSELKRVLTSFQCNCPLIITGENRDDYLKEPLQSSGCEEKQIGLSAEELRFAIPLGLAFDYLVHRVEPLQFRQHTDLSSLSLRILGRNAFVLLLVSVFCSLSLYLGGTHWLTQREQILSCELEEKIKKDPSLEKELRGKKDLTSQVQQWARLVQRNAKDYPFIHQGYRVAEVLDWLNQYTQVSVEHIHYQLVSFPRLEALKEPYLVKLELELVVTDPLHAHQFHEFLLKGEGFCDASREITWDVLSDRYRASFYLKNRASCWNY